MQLVSQQLPAARGVPAGSAGDAVVGGSSFVVVLSGVSGKRGRCPCERGHDVVIRLSTCLYLI